MDEGMGEDYFLEAEYEDRCQLDYGADFFEDAELDESIALDEMRY